MKVPKLRILPYVALVALTAVLTSRAGAVPLPPTPPDHFLCYNAKAEVPPHAVGVADQFYPETPLTLIADKLNGFCNPVRKNDTGVNYPLRHMTCYSLKQQPKPLGMVVHVMNQFEIEPRHLIVAEPTQFCLPATKSENLSVPPAQGPDSLLFDHFLCYNVKSLDAPFVPFVVRLQDQFMPDGLQDFVVEKVVSLCNPADKNDEGITDPVNHYVCYSLNKGPKGKRQVLGWDQFTPIEPSLVVPVVTVLEPLTLCLPSEKQVGHDS
jgi:hypothetical protein